MKTSGNTILITGGGSGIGLALALEFKKQGNQVIVAGRSAEKLADAKARGLDTATVDMTRAESLATLARETIEKYPALNVVIHNAGIMQNEKATTKAAAQVAIDTIATNLTGPILLTNALLPHLLKQKDATIMTVTSGLAFVPLAMTPTYSASKAAIHSYTQSLRYQLKDTNVRVQELVPPYVRTSLMGARQAADANAMPLEEFVAEVFAILRETPNVDEITVKRVLPQRTAGQDREAHAVFFTKQNEMLFQVRKAEWDKL